MPQIFRDHRTRLRAVLCALGCALSWSMAADAAGPRDPTTPTSIGIFYVRGAPEVANLWREGDTGERLNLRGRVLGRDGEPVAGALVELWHADADGGVDESRYRTAQRTGADGTFGIRTILPGHIELAQGNAVFGPRHIHIVVTHPGFRRLVSLIYFQGDPLVEESAYPELAIPVERARAGGRDILLGRAEIVIVRSTTPNPNVKP